MRYLACLVAIVCALCLATPLWAHANLERSEPAANAVLEQEPAEIRLWFSEPLESGFSSFTLRSTDGASVELANVQIDPADAHQLFAPLPALEDGLYTVVWQAVSAADGHGTQGSFPFRIGQGELLAPPVEATLNEETTIPAGSAAIRWFNFLSLALLVGSLAFVLFVWDAAGLANLPAAVRRLTALQWIGWLATGLAGALMLWLQASIVTQAALTAPPNDQVVEQIVTSTRFGALWTVRMGLWVVSGMAIVLSLRLAKLRWLALAAGLGLLATTSLYSHASAAQASALAISSDWLHLVLTTVWVGGLASLLVVMAPLRNAHVNDQSGGAHVAGVLVGHFSNFVRVAVAGLIITGLYAAWLQVGSVDALTTTLYGQALATKLLLLLPLLGLATVNFWLTHRRLQAGRAVWVGRLRALVGVELLLVVAMLAAVGVMTSLSPARTVLVQRDRAAQLAAAKPIPQPIHDLQAGDELQVHLIITPGWVGENEFQIALSTLDNETVTNASLIRLRFEDQEQAMGESELRITTTKDGLYTVRGANLSLPGNWRIRTTVQRPDQFDTVVDFEPSVAPPPPPTPPLMRDPAAPLPYRLPVLLWTGALAAACGLIFLVRARFRILQGGGLLATALVVLGCLFLTYALFRL